ncbi:dol-P-Glc:Glc(2)Man(9)GlcNAc(2)-PP-Dol alpha-1,2-glucosyltransferase [Telopea speciosissima]|uniref:dol-P-Glc:Glc(2)Man(9)GlcNAc(2)-PP-Dol alpha-1,2-glucosyltransferase n=1 Tax=Telopea speciosissima TaxID=54955 RepID=UPI001CC62433|nr:dol-P-Glc:Glc(2)Man(9)GlcNAc(2)-PP-Dol alpha-1,2-glucosyltransferase [Telopea speciosissima]
MWTIIAGSGSCKEMGRMAVAAMVSSWVIPIIIMVNRFVPEPYMDEIFHIPQAQQYCKGNFKSWDPMITTPPGLYYLSLAHVASLFPGMWCVQAASSVSDMCSTAVLRSMNGILAVICSILVYDILTHLRPGLDKRKATLYTVVIALYPVHWFFTFLYYTDVASVAAVLAMYLACLKKHYLISSMLGALAVFIRQTNVIWMLFVACTGAINFLLAPNRKDIQLNDAGLSIRKSIQLTDNRSVPGYLNLRKRKSSGAMNVASHSMSVMNTSSLTHSSGLFDEFSTIFFRLWHLKWEILLQFGPFLLVLLAFVTFVLWNGSIVLGAKEAHSISPHFAQIMYFSLVTALAMAPLHFTLGRAKVLCRTLWRMRPMSFIKGLVVLLAGFLAVHFFSIAHPYLLADNRHYTFYVWRKVMRAHWSMKYILVPFYAYSWLSICSNLGKVQKNIWILVFFCASAAVLIPAPLIEFRYFTIPFFFLILHSQIKDDKSWFLMGILYIVVNTFTMLMFLFRPFHWDHEPGIQRFIW